MSYKIDSLVLGFLVWTREVFYTDIAMGLTHQHDSLCTQGLRKGVKSVREYYSTTYSNITVEVAAAAIQLTTLSI